MKMTRIQNLKTSRPGILSDYTQGSSTKGIPGVVSDADFHPNHGDNCALSFGA